MRNEPTTRSNDRYQRHRSLLEPDAWSRLTTTTLTIAGVGGLGSHVLSSLARLGPLHLELWDPGVVDTPDLNRQILYTPADEGRRKVESARERLLQVNPELSVTVHAEPITAEAFADHGEPGSARGVFDCLDSFAARVELEKIRRSAGVPVFHGGVEGFFGQATTFLPDRLGYEDVFGPGYEGMPPAPKPILPQTVAIVAALQVGECIHWCADPRQTPLTGTLLLYDGRTMQFDRITVAAS
ncbi:MAG: HesA/MoeB/ThiF family protein [Alkalispirochaeta sp.]